MPRSNIDDMRSIEFETNGERTYLIIIYYTRFMFVFIIASFIM